MNSFTNPANLVIPNFFGIEEISFKDEAGKTRWEETFRDLRKKSEFLDLAMKIEPKLKKQYEEYLANPTFATKLREKYYQKLKE